MRRNKYVGTFRLVFQPKDSISTASTQRRGTRHGPLAVISAATLPFQGAQPLFIMNVRCIADSFPPDCPPQFRLHRRRTFSGTSPAAPWCPYPAQLPSMSGESPRNLKFISRAGDRIHAVQRCQLCGSLGMPGSLALRIYAPLCSRGRNR